MVCIKKTGMVDQNTSPPPPPLPKKKKILTKRTMKHRKLEK